MAEISFYKFNSRDLFIGKLKNWKIGKFKVAKWESASNNTTSSSPPGGRTGLPTYLLLTWTNSPALRLRAKGQPDRQAGTNCKSKSWNALPRI